MKISVNSQLGLMMDDNEVSVEFLKLLMGRWEQKRDALAEIINKRYDPAIKELTDARDAVESGKIELTEQEVQEILDKHQCDLSQMPDYQNIHTTITERIGDDKGNFINNDNSKLYLVCDGVEACSKMVRIGDNFSSKALRNISFGKHTYLLGKDEVCRFLCGKGAIKGIYWKRSEKIAFEFGFDLETDGYYFDELYAEQFNRVTKIITFIELGDIETIILERGRNNGKTKAEGKITNTSNYTVYVVDSSWNKLIIRTEGFAVMGHFRLQPCGAGLIDRKLIWINAFEKHGYTRRPRAEIIHH